MVFVKLYNRNRLFNPNVAEQSLRRTTVSHEPNAVTTAMAACEAGDEQICPSSIA